MLLALGAVPGGRASSLAVWGEPQVTFKVPHTRGCRRSQPPLPGSGSTVLRNAGIAPCWLMASPVLLPASSSSVQVQAPPGKPLLVPRPPGWNPPCHQTHHASSGARTSGLVKRLRHCSRVKWPARAASLAEPGSSMHSSSLDSTNTNSLRRSLFFHTRAREQLSVSSKGVSPAQGAHSSHACPTRLGQATLLGLDAC